jgi:hypothetical protein
MRYALALLAFCISVNSIRVDKTVFNKFLAIDEIGCCNTTVSELFSDEPVAEEVPFANASAAAVDLENGLGGDSPELNEALPIHNLEDLAVAG